MVKPVYKHRKQHLTLMFLMVCTISCCVFPGQVSSEEMPIPFELNEKMGRNISLDLRDMDVVDVYKFLSLRGDFNISISKNLVGRVTLYLKNVSIKDAVDIISISNELAYDIVGENIIHVMTESEYQSMYGKRFNDKRVVKIIRLDYVKPAYALETLKNIKSDIGRVVIDEDTGAVVIIDTPEIVKKMEGTLDKMDQSLDIHVYDLKYADVGEVASKLKEKIDNKAVGSTQADTRSNQLIVRAFPERLKEAEQIIEALDKKTKAVLIEVRIIKIVFKPGFDMGINWEQMFLKFRDLAITGSFPISSTITAAGTGIGTIGIGSFGHSDLATEIKLLKQVSSTKVLANPSLMVVNNKEAKIHIGDKLAYVTTTTIGTGDSQRVNEEIHYIDVGVKFLVTPVINDDGFITMKIKPEISSKSGELTTPQNAKVPLINTTQVETSVLIQNGHTVIIAGLRQDDIAESNNGLPVLMDIPIIGNLFKNTSNARTKTEIAILMTPHIVGGSENFVDQEELKTTIKKAYKRY